jgi:two-component system chemotaxis sensor kinase CheA
VASTAKQSILIVDDEFGLGEMLQEMLREAGFEVTLAINGRSALEILEEETVDLVLTDMMMPVVDGAELAAAMRNDHRHRDTPIIMMTSLPTSRPQPAGLFDGILRKPFTPELLLETIVRCLSTQDATDSERGPNGQEGSDGDATA